MKRALSQPLLWVRSPASASRDRSTTTDQLAETVTKLSVRWEDHSGSEDERSPPLSRAKRKTITGHPTRRFSLLSPSTFGRTEIDRVPGAVEIGSFVRSRAPALHQTVTETQLTLETRGIHYCALFAGKGSTICSKYLHDNLQSHIAQTFENIEPGSSVSAVAAKIESILTEAFKRCDAKFTLEHPRDSSGSCAVVSLVHDRMVHVAWAGESRALFCRGNEIKGVSWDHRPTHEAERKRILNHGGLITGGQILGVLSASRGFGENDVKTHFSDGVFISRPTVITFKTDDDGSSPSQKTRFLIVASQSVFAVVSNDVACKIVNRSLHHSENNPNVAAEKLAKYAFKKCQQECSVVVIVWNEPHIRSRSSSLTSWRSFRSFSTHETEDCGITPTPSPAPLS